MQVWRIHIRPSGLSPEYSFRVCLKQKMLGVGWALAHPPDDRFDVEAYLKQAEVEYAGDRSCRSAIQLLANMAKGDLVWTRDTKGVYYLAKVNGPYEYRDKKENLDADICNLRAMRLVKIAEPSRVPGKVIASMRAGRVVQRIYSDAVHTFSQYLYAKQTGDGVPPDLTGQDIFDYLSDQECEDIVYVMMQRMGWVVFPATRKADTMSYEYVLCNVEDGREAVVQVRTGNSPIDLDALPEHLPAFVFQPKGCYEGVRRDGVKRLDRGELLAFMRANRKLLPHTVQDWMRLVEGQ